MDRLRGIALSAWQTLVRTSTGTVSVTLYGLARNVRFTLGHAIRSVLAVLVRLRLTA
jgi:hypothetical protein